MVTRHPLDNSPPRLSDMDDREALRAALVVRDSEARAAWLAGRQPKRGFFARLFGKECS